MGSTTISFEYIYSVLMCLSISALILSVTLSFKCYLVKEVYPWLMVSAGLLYYLILRFEMLIDYVIKFNKVGLGDIFFELAGFGFTFAMMLGFYYITRPETEGKKT